MIFTNQSTMSKFYAMNKYYQTKDTSTKHNPECCNNLKLMSNTDTIRRLDSKNIRGSLMVLHLSIICTI